MIDGNGKAIKEIPPGACSTPSRRRLLVDEQHDRIDAPSTTTTQSTTATPFFNVGGVATVLGTNSIISRCLARPPARHCSRSGRD